MSTKIIRQSLEKVAIRLGEQIRATRLTLATEVTDANAADLLKTYSVQSSRMSRSIESIRREDESWQNLIEALEDDEQEAEYGLYDKLATATSGYLDLIHEAEDVLEELSYLKSSPDPCSAHQIMKSRDEERIYQRNVARGLPVATADSNGNNDGHSPKTANVRLPKFELQKFNGKLSDWPKFWSMFNHMVHSHTSIPDVQKFAYLHSCLQGVASEVISGLLISETNYPIAIGILSNRFGRPDTIIESLYQRLQKMKTASDSSSEIRKKIDAVEQVLMQLEGAGESVDSRSCVRLVIQKFSSSTMKKVQSVANFKGLSWDMPSLRKALREFVEMDELTEQYYRDFESLNPSEKPKDSGKNQSGHSSHSSAFAAPASKSSKSVANKTAGVQRAMRCIFCAEEHPTNFCARYNNVQSRVSRATQLGLCRLCLGKNHKAADCRARLRCTFCQSSGEHSSALCPRPRGSAQKDTPGTKSDQNKPQPPTTVSGLAVGNQSILQTASVMVKNPITGRSVKARILFDNGSQRSYITNSLVGKLNLKKSDPEEIGVSVFGAKRTSTFTSHRVTANLLLRSSKYESLTMNTTKTITNALIQQGPLRKDDYDYLSQMRSDLADDLDVMNRGGPIDILVGSEYFWDFMGSNRKHLGSGLQLVSSSCGWVLAGRFSTTTSSVRDSMSMLCLSADAKLCTSDTFGTFDGLKSVSAQPEDIKSLWDLESLGVVDNPSSNDDDRAMESFQRSIQLKDNRYWVGWPWISEDNVPSENFGLAMGRFRSLIRRLSKDEELRKSYDKVIQEQLQLGIIESVDTAAPNSTNPKSYIPHQPVIKPSSQTTKVRIVYDASAKTKKSDLSLNDCLYPGPNLMSSLCGIWVRFRLKPIGVIADIEKAYLQLMLHEADRDVTRFFWLKDASLPEPALSANSNIITLRFCRVPFGVLASAFLLNATVRYHLLSQSHPAATEAASSIYVDNIVSSFDNPEAAGSYYQDVKRIFNSASMNVREWCSNSKQFRESLPAADAADTAKISVLGLQWNVFDDTLSLQKFWTDNYRNVRTKRQVLHVIARIYDPLGLWSPVTLHGKRFLQKLWTSNLDWDTSFDPNLQSEWTDIADVIKHLSGITFPRHFPFTSSEVSLVVFCDASELAYACCVYLLSRQPDSGQEFTTSLGFAKSRLTTVKHKMSIPRLELMGLLIGVRAAKFVRENLGMEVKNTRIFTDSACCLFWLKTSKLLPVFIKNRVKEIRSIEGLTFHHVRTEDNPADLGTRGASVTELANSKLWWYGPPWLSLDQSLWNPSDVDVSQIESERKEDLELKSTPISEGSFVAGEGPAPTNSLEPYPMLINPAEYSDLRKIYRITAWRLKIFKQFVWNKLSENSKTSVISSAPVLRQIMPAIATTQGICAADIAAAKTYWDYSVQRRHLPELFKDVHLGKKTDLWLRFDLKIDDFGILRGCGRLQNSNLPEESICPKILPSSSQYTDMVIQDIHRRVMHAGASHTLSQVRLEYWIPKGRTIVGRIIRRCLVCRRMRQPPFTIPLMPPLPKSRVTKSPPFSYTGLDYLGPVSIKSCDGASGKNWICLFTCLATRAIHLEVVEDCSAKQFLNCLIRFVSRRGMPKQIVSDNAPQFKVVKTAVDKAWRNLLFDPSVRYYSSEQGINWHFITELAPWQGGFYERLVAIVKTCLKSVIGRRLLTFQELSTLVIESEAVVNSRPLTFVYGDADSWHPLTPGDFLSPGRGVSGFPDLNATGLAKEFGDAGKLLISHWKHRQVKLNALWDIWQKEYLSALQDKSRRFHRNPRSSHSRFPTVGEIVIVKGEPLPRGAWKLARISAVFPGSDGVIRAAEITQPNGVVTRRSVGHLIPLEVGAPLPAEANGDNSEDFEGFSAADVEDARDRLHNYGDAERPESA